VGELEKEVVSGRCVLIENQEGVAERVVSLTALRMKLRCGKILVVLAKKSLDSEGDFEPEGQLPGVKQEQGELPTQALRRMMREIVRPFAKDLRVHKLERDDRHEHSARYRIKTKYIRVIYSATLPDDFTTHCEQYPQFKASAFVSSQFPSHFLKRWVPEPKMCYLLKDSRSEYVCAFMEPEALDHFRKAGGRKQLSMWASTLVTRPTP